MRPIIGMLVAIDDERKASAIGDYAHAIEESGGVPLVLPFVENEATITEFVALCNGFLFTGGVDVAPSYYGEEKSEFCGEIQHYRDELELRVLKHLLETDKPILGICRGAQVINVALGGTLYQDLPSEHPSDIAHRQTNGTYALSHEVQITPGSPLHALFGCERSPANSFHHQAIKALGRGLTPMAYADDGVIEAVYSTDARYLRAYQWHPERLFSVLVQNRLIFEDFIAHCISKNK